MIPFTLQGYEDKQRFNIETIVCACGYTGKPRSPVSARRAVAGERALASCPECTRQYQVRVDGK